MRWTTLLLAIFASTAAAAGKPEVTTVKFSSQPSKIIYFGNYGEAAYKDILLQEGSRVWTSQDGGKVFSLKEQIDEPLLILQHPNDLDRAFIFGHSGKTNYWTKDLGKTWTLFSLPFPLVSLSKSAVAFHAVDVDKAFYSLDSFLSFQELLKWTSQCEWAQSISPTLVQQASKIFCTIWPTSEQSGDVALKDPSLLRLVSSESYFADGSMNQIYTSGGIPVLGLTPNWLVGIVKSNGYQMIITKDGSKFEKSIFNGLDNAQFVAFSVLESSNSSLIVDVVSSRPYSQLPLPFGTLFVSSSDGKYFTKVLEHTNRDIASGLVDFEHIQASMYEGVHLANTVKNWEAVQSKNEFVVKELTTFMSFDNGRSWNQLAPPALDSNGGKFSCTPLKEDAGDNSCALHLHSVTTTKNVGKVFSVSTAPGTIIGVGSVGSSLLPYQESDTFISHDSGVSWIELRKGPHKFEVVNFGAIIVLVPDTYVATSELFYSKNGGKDWEAMEVLVDDSKWIPLFTTLDTNSTSLHMLMVVSKGSSSGEKFLVRIGFESIFSRKCDANADESNQDLELYKLISPTKSCILGRSASYFRRKALADCWVDVAFQTVPPISDSCPCSLLDLECNNGFSPDPNSESLVCLEDGPVLDQPLDCPAGQKYKGLSGYRLIAGNHCVGGDQSKLIPVSKECKAGHTKPPADPLSYLTVFDDQVVELIQVPSSQSSIILTKQGKVWRSVNQGETWNIVVIPNGDAISKIIVHSTAKDRIFLFTKDKIYFSADALSSSSLEEMKTPIPYNNLGLPVLDFHPTQPDWYTFLGGARDCSSSSRLSAFSGDADKSCFTTAYFTKDGGKTFSDPIDTWASKCLWARDTEFRSKKLSEDAIFCSSLKMKKVRDSKKGGQGEQDSDSNPTLLFLVNDPSSKLPMPLIQENVLDFYVVKNVLVVAAKKSSGPTIYTSVDGQTFIEATFPPASSFVKKGMTILKSETGGVFLDISQSSVKGAEYGILFKSNENGDFFSKSLANTNRGFNGKVDFMKMPGIEGVAITNIVSNPGLDKQIESRISYNDGSTWSPIVGPIVDEMNQSVCSQKECKLHVHLQSTVAAYKGMLSPFGTKNSAGLTIVVGSVGEHLEPYENCNVYITRDAGKSWQQVRKGPHLWAFADSGGLLALISDSEPVVVVSYSWNYGISWADYQFSDQGIEVESIVAHDGSAKLIVTGHASTGEKRRTLSTMIDFGHVFTRNCEAGDYEVWKPSSNDCFFGAKITFMRRKIDSICFMKDGFQASIPAPETCECSENDFECDSNFFRNSVGDCVLLGKDPKQPPSCATGEKYDGLSGYRKISLSKCTNGLDMTKNVERECNASPADPENVDVSAFTFPHSVEDFYQFKNSTVILVKDTERSVYIAYDGMSWKLLDYLASSSVLTIEEDPFWPNRIFLVALDKLVVTNDFGSSFAEIGIPSFPNIHLASTFLSSHPLHQDWLLWIGSEGCLGDFADCRAILYVSFDSGVRWSEVDTYVSSCQWAWTKDFQISSEKTVLCTGYQEKHGDQRSMSKSFLLRYDVADSAKEVLLETRMFAIEGEYLVTAVPNSNSKSMDLFVSLDAERFSAASLPSQLAVIREGYTVLESNTGNLFICMIESIVRGAEYGSIIKSNWNGTFFLTSLEGINVNSNGFVDFEKIEGISGTIIANQVVNADDLPRGATKKMQSKISFDDGESWSDIKSPSRDSKGEPFKCANFKSDDRPCGSLHLHAFTERHDKRDSYSSPGAIGLLIGVGNVGDHLGEFKDGDMFLSRDGGRSWTEIVKEAHMVEISDHGGIILMVNDEEPITSFKYSLDDGHSFYDRDISKELDGQKFRIQNIVADHYGPSSNTFTLIGKLSSNGSTVSLHLDFSNVWNRKCAVNKEDSSKSDFEVWNPYNQSCAFGANVDFFRRKSSTDCYIGDSYLEATPITEACECTLSDYDCDQFHVWDNDACVPIPNVYLPAPACINGFRKPLSGYVKKKISHCAGGKSLDADPVPCGGSVNSISWPVAFFVILPITLLSAYVLYLYSNGGLGRHGAIYLPLDTGPRSEMERAWNGVANVAGKAHDVLLGLWVKLMDFIQFRSRSAQGYEPVSNYYDPDMPTSSSFEELWNDEDA